MITEATLDRALAAIKKGRANYEYFFDSLSSPEWILPLAEKGFFGKPPEAVREGRYVSIPHWPESQYLARMAEAAPDQVLNAILRIPDTDNWRVSDDILDAALKLPPRSAARLLPRLKRTVDGTYAFPFPDKLAELAIRLAEGGLTREATGLLDAVLALRVADPGESGRSRPNVLSKIEAYEFEQILKDHVPRLVESTGSETFELLVRLTERFAELSQWSTEGGELSHVERPAIEDHEQNWRHGIIDPIVEAVRDTAVGLVEEDRTRLAALVARLTGERPLILARIALFLVSAFPADDPGLLRDTLLSRRSFDSVPLRHEYSCLMRLGFGLLAPGDQEVILGWIEDQDLERIGEQLRSVGEEPTEDRVLSLADIHRLERLVPIKESLPAPWRARFDDLVARRGEPEHPDFTIYHMGFVGPTSPVGPDEFSRMVPSEVAAFVRDWVPETGSFDAPTPEGLARQLGEAVKARVGEFSAEAGRFVGLGPTYVRLYLQGIEQAAREGNRPEWEPIVSLCEWVMGQEVPEQGTERSGLDEDPDWRWSRQQVAGLLDTGLSASRVRPAPDLRGRVWAVIERLADDPDPTPEHEAQYGGVNMNPPTLAINTTRGRAMHAVVHYLLWQREVLGERFTLGDAPEARAALEFHLRSENDPSLAVRSTYGQFAPWLAMIDEAWFVENRSGIFDAREGMSDFWSAAWDTYVALCPPYSQMAALLDSEYRHAVDLSRGATNTSGMWDAQESLAFHLLIFYARGTMPLEGEGAFAYLLENGPVWARAKGLSKLGHDLYRNEQKPQGEFVFRLRTLWERLLSEGRTGAAEDVETFGWWFAAGVFDDEWSMGALLSALRITPDLDSAHVIVERLANLAASNPQKAFEALRLLSQSKSSRWEFAYQNEKAAQILTVALRSGDENLVRQATEYINLLGAKGLQWYRKLLS